ncbi:hypothetical protein [uncultured Sphaerochaeta sp.]|uniref:hypothetical protein n=1 Tax=uncultured Sphaerochaeta sp. TaxID=886478 RepID=UPI002A0A2301|nr:hypothetical protein [uncultured Sphaerochaeta sp.]
MENNKPMILHLFQELPYILDTENPRDLSLAYGDLLDRIDRSEIGSEICIALSPVLTVLFTAFQEPPTEELRQAVAQGLPHPKRKQDITIASGDYHFVQLPMTPTKEEVEQILLPLSEMQACDGASTIYIRMIKENLLEVIVQVLWAV